MSSYSFLAIQLHFIWGSEQTVLKNFFETNNFFSSKRPSQISLDYTLESTNDEKHRLGLSKCTIVSEKSINLTYRAMIETTIDSKHPIWKHDTFIYTITKYLEEINSASSIFLQPNISCAIDLFNEGELAILDETGALIEGPYKKVDMIHFDTDKSINDAVDEALRKSLSSFQKVHPYIGD